MEDKQTCVRQRHVRKANRLALKEFARRELKKTDVSCVRETKRQMGRQTGTGSYTQASGRQTGRHR